MGVKALIDTGANLPLKEALTHEYTTSHAHNDALNLSGMSAKLNQLKSKK